MHRGIRRCSNSPPRGGAANDEITSSAGPTNQVGVWATHTHLRRHQSFLFLYITFLHLHQKKMLSWALSKHFNLVCFSYTCSIIVVAFHFGKIGRRLKRNGILHSANLDVYLLCKFCGFDNCIGGVNFNPFDSLVIVNCPFLNLIKSYG
jgi:hypothetical protein